MAESQLWIRVRVEDREEKAEADSEALNEI